MSIHSELFILNDLKFSKSAEIIDFVKNLVDVSIKYEIKILWKLLKNYLKL